MASTTVTVGCKLANGLIIEVGDKKAILNGANSAVLIGGHGITENVDKELFDAWMAQNKELTFVKAGLLFAHDKATNTAAQAKEQAEVETGLEGVDPGSLPAGIELVVAK